MLFEAPRASVEQQRDIHNARCRVETLCLSSHATDTQRKSASLRVSLTAA